LNIPEYFRTNNTQHELTVHNLNAIQPWLHLAYIIVSLYVATAHTILFKCLQLKRSYLFSLLAPQGAACCFGCVTFIIYSLYELNKQLGLTFPIIARDQEVAELFLSIATFLHARSAYFFIQDQRDL
jgi:hypothetical protein